MDNSCTYTLVLLEHFFVVWECRKLFVCPVLNVLHVTEDVAETVYRAQFAGYGLKNGHFMESSGHMVFH